MPKPALRRSLNMFGQRVAELREDRELTQHDLAERASLSLRYTQMVEAGEANMTFATLVAIAAALRVDVHELFVPSASRPRRRRGRPRKNQP